MIFDISLPKEALGVEKEPDLSTQKMSFEIITKMLIESSGNGFLKDADLRSYTRLLNHLDTTNSTEIDVDQSGIDFLEKVYLKDPSVHPNHVRAHGILSKRVKALVDADQSEG